MCVCVGGGGGGEGGITYPFVSLAGYYTYSFNVHALGNKDAQCNYWHIAKQQRCTVQKGITVFPRSVAAASKTFTAAGGR